MKLRSPSHHLTSTSTPNTHLVNCSNGGQQTKGADAQQMYDSQSFNQNISQFSFAADMAASDFSRNIHFEQNRHHPSRDLSQHISKLVVSQRDFVELKTPKSIIQQPPQMHSNQTTGRIMNSSNNQSQLSQFSNFQENNTSCPLRYQPQAKNTQSYPNSIEIASKKSKFSTNERLDYQQNLCRRIHDVLKTRANKSQNRSSFRKLQIATEPNSYRKAGRSRDFMPQEDQLSTQSRQKVDFKNKGAVNDSQLQRSTMDMSVQFESCISYQSLLSQKQIPHRQIIPQMNFVKQKTEILDAKDPGSGLRSESCIMKKYTDEIVLSLNDDDFVDRVYEKSSIMLTLAECERDGYWLNKKFDDMDNPGFWLQKGLLCSQEGKQDAALDYYRQGLRTNPTEKFLLYSLARSYLTLFKFDSAIRWFQFGLNLDSGWLDGLYGTAITYFNIKNFEKALSYIEIIHKDLKNQPNKENSSIAKITIEKVILLQATCLKKVSQYDKASAKYHSLKKIFAGQLNSHYISLMWGCILTPLYHDRRAQADHFRNLQEELEHIKDEPKPEMIEQNMLLSRYCFGAFKDQKGYTVDRLIYHDDQVNTRRLLNFVDFPGSIWTLLWQKPFFKRFKNLNNPVDKLTIQEIFARAEIELYRKEQNIFLAGRVGIVTMGSCEIRTHAEPNLLKPSVLKKAIEGDVLGFNLNEDANTILSPLSWLISLQDDTEVLFLSTGDFKKLWSMHSRFQDQLLVLLRLNQNRCFRQLNTCTKHKLVFECIQMRKYYPGQLIISVHQRSPLSKLQDRLELEQCSLKMRIQRRIQNRKDKYRINNTELQSLIKELKRRKSAEIMTHTQMINMKQSSSQVELIVDSTSSMSQGDLRQKGMDTPASTRRSGHQHNRVHFDDARSNSTDYGVEHCQQLITSKDQEVEQMNPTDFISDFDLQKSFETRTIELDDNMTMTQPIVKLKKNVSFQVIPSVDESTQKSRQNRLSLPGKSWGKFAKIQRRSKSFKIVEPNWLTQDQGEEQQPKLVSHDDIKSQVREQVSQKQCATRPQNKQILQPKMNRFLFQNYIDQIEQNNKPLKEELKKRKVHIKHMIRFVAALEQSIVDAQIINTHQLRSHLKTFAEDFEQTQTQTDLPKGSSGFWNSHLIEQMTQPIEKILKQISKVKSAEQVLLKFLVQEIDAKFLRYIDPDGVNLIATGCAYVLGPDGQQRMKVHTADLIGYSDIFKVPGPEFMGDVRAGLAPVQTYFLPFKDLKRHLSFPEKKKMSASAKDTRMDKIADFLVRQNKIEEPDKLRLYQIFSNNRDDYKSIEF